MDQANVLAKAVGLAASLGGLYCVIDRQSSVHEHLWMGQGRSTMRGGVGQRGGARGQGCVASGVSFS